VFKPCLLSRAPQGCYRGARAGIYTFLVATEHVLKIVDRTVIRAAPRLEHRPRDRVEPVLNGMLGTPLRRS